VIDGRRSLRSPGLQERDHVACKALWVLGPHEMTRAPILDDPGVRKPRCECPLRFHIRLMVLETGDDQDRHRQPARTLEAVVQYS
jgi:hypothetical protein